LNLGCPNEEVRKKIDKHLEKLEDYLEQLQSNDIVESLEDELDIQGINKEIFKKSLPTDKNMI
jgi:hypothetical protein